MTPCLLPDVAYIDLRGLAAGQFANMVAAKLGQLGIHGTTSQVASDEQGGTGGGVPDEPLIVERWRTTMDGTEVPTLMRLCNNSISHPGYVHGYDSSRASMRVGVVMPCSQLGPELATSNVRSHFLAFLERVDFLGRSRQIQLWSGSR